MRHLYRHESPELTNKLDRGSRRADSACWEHECLEHALARPGLVGIWAATTPVERSCNPCHATSASARWQQDRLPSRAGPAEADPDGGSGAGSLVASYFDRDGRMSGWDLTECDQNAAVVRGLARFGGDRFGRCDREFTARTNTVPLMACPGPGYDGADDRQVNRDSGLYKQRHCGPRLRAPTTRAARRMTRAATGRVAVPNLPPPREGAAHRGPEPRSQHELLAFRARSRSRWK